jgi:hypothetical protein
MSDNAAWASPTAKRTYIVVGVAAAATAAAATAYVFWRRSRQFAPQVETVQQLLDRCHTQIRSIEQKLGDLATSTTA